MQILDLSQTVFSVAFSQLKNVNELDEDKFRYIVLNCIRSYVNKNKSSYGELVIACDSASSWRKDIFPYYKASRKKKREESQIDWGKIFQAFDIVKSELKEYFPYRVINVDKAEADDIIYVLCKMFAKNKILILSGDTDFVQLHTKNIAQYDIVRKKQISTKNKNYLLEHIIEGDVSDGIPNVLSQDDTFVLNKRQKRLTKGRREYFLNVPFENFNNTEKRNYLRNKQLIDLTHVPHELELKIIEDFDSQNNKNKSKLFNYFYDKKLTSFIEAIQEF